MHEKFLENLCNSFNDFVSFKICFYLCINMSEIHFKFQSI